MLILFSVLIGCEEVVEEAAQQLFTTISGTVTDDGAPVEGAIVLLIESQESIIEGLDLTSGSISLASGSYIISLDVEPGNYYVCAIKDENGNQSYDIDTDPIGYYGGFDTTLTVPIPSPEEVTVENEGDDIEGIDIEDMYILAK